MAILEGGFPRHTLHEAISDYVSSRRKGQFVSVADAVQAIRYLYPQPGHSDGELARLISDAAVKSGCNVSFDCTETRAGMFKTPQGR